MKSLKIGLLHMGVWNRGVWVGYHFHVLPDLQPYSILLLNSNLATTKTAEHDWKRDSHQGPVDSRNSSSISSNHTDIWRIQSYHPSPKCRPNVEIYQKPKNLGVLASRSWWRSIKLQIQPSFQGTKRPQPCIKWRVYQP